MVRRCCLPGCDSTSNNKPIHHVPAKKYYSGPKHQWAIALEKFIRSYRKDDWLDRLYQRDDLWICQDHFPPSELEKNGSKIRLRIGAIPILNLPAKSISPPVVTARPPPTARKLPDKIHHRNSEELRKSAARYLPKSWKFEEYDDHILIYSGTDKLGIFPKLALKISNSMHAHAGYCGWFTSTGLALQSIDVGKMTLASMLTMLSEFSVCEGISCSGHCKDLPDNGIAMHNQVVYHHTYDMDMTPQPPTLQLIAARSKECEVFLTKGKKCKSCTDAERSMKITQVNKESYKQRVANKLLKRKRSTSMNTRLHATVHSQQQQ